MRPSMHLPLLFFLLHLQSTTVTSNPIAFQPEVNYAHLLGRSACATYCGFSSQLCCSTGFACYTDQNNDAQCTALAFNPTPTIAAGFVSTATSTIVCNGNIGQIACINTCCDAGQSCVAPGSCSGSSATPALVSSAPASVAATVTTAPGTDVAPATVTTTAAVATVTTISTAVVNSGLDSGSIAGIVIGVLVGILVLGWMFQPLMNKRRGSEKSVSVVSRSSRGYGGRRSKR